MKASKIIVVLVLIGAIVAFFATGLNEQLTFANLKAQRESLQAFASQNFWLAVAAYMGAYIAVTGLSLPGAAVMTLAGGFIFGTVTGTIAVSFASTIGATLAFLAARFILRDWVQEKFGGYLKSINQGVEKDGGFYLFTLRLIPAVPFFVINTVMGLTPIRVVTFFVVSQIGMLPGTIVYVNAGTQLGQLESLSGILSPQLLGSFVLLAIFPFLIRGLMDNVGSIVRVYLARRKAFKGHKKPKQYDYNVVVIGAGAAGLVTSYISAAVKAKVALIEKHLMGGDCLNFGCVPSKALIQSAKMVNYTKRAKDFGFKSASVEFDFADIMERVQRVIKKIEPADSVERYTGLGVECFEGTGTIKSPFEVEVNGKTLTTKNIVVAAGAGPMVPPFDGLDQIKYYTTDTIWEIREQPKRLLILGGGPIGCELSQAFNRLGTHVVQVEMAPQLLGREDKDVSDFVYERFKQEGVEVLLNHKAKGFGNDGGQNYVVLEHDGQDKKVEFDIALFALGRKARTEGYGLENVGVGLNERRTIAVNDFLQTTMPNVYVCGDATGPFQFTHVAAHQAWFCAVNALFYPFKLFKADYRVIPWVTFTDPEIGRVGLNETEAKEKDIPYEVTVYDLDDSDRAIADDEDEGFVKVLTVPGKDKILGATIVGVHAGELITEFVTAMKQGFGLNTILGTIHSYPTMAEANKSAAGVWKKAHSPQKVLGYLQKFHAWRRG